MSIQTVPFEAVRALCAAREVDLVLSAPPRPYVVSWQGQFNGYGDFFSILAQDVEYIDTPGGLTVGDLRLTPDVEAIAAMTPRWASIKGRYSGPALVIRTADSDDWPTANAQDLSLIMANVLVFRRGSDWEAAHRRPP